MTNTLTTRRQIDEWIKHPLIRVVLQWMAANRSDLREVDAKFQAALAATPREIPDDFRRWAAGRKNVFYEESPPAFHSGGRLIEAALERYSAIVGDIAKDEPKSNELHLVLTPSTVSALNAGHPRPTPATEPGARPETD
jgi:hypothetical protein